MELISHDFSNNNNSSGLLSRLHSQDNFSASSSVSSYTHHQSFSNASISLTSSKSSAAVNFLDGCFGFQFFLNTVFLGCLCIVGFVGNTISFLVFQRDRHNRVPVFLLQSLAVADNSVLCTAFIALSVFYGILPIFGQEAEDLARPYIVRYLNPLGCVAQSCTIWMTVLLAINRYMAVCRPFTSEKWLTIKHARIQVFIVVFLSVLVNIPRVFEKDIYRIAANSTVTVGTTSSTAVGGTSASSTAAVSSAAPTETVTNGPINAYWYFEVVYLNAFYTSVILILPILLLIGFNIPLVHQLQTSKRQMIRNSLSYSGQQENNMTVVMVMIILEMIICHSPDRVVQIIRIFVKDGLTCPSTFYYATNIANFLVILNSSTDFVVYYVFRNRFRTILCDQLLLCRGGRPRSDSRDSAVLVGWNSRTADQGANPLVAPLNGNHRGSQVGSPVQRTEGDGTLQSLPENDHQTKSLVGRSDLMVTEPHSHKKKTSFAL